jgi:hypothetical protein
VLISAFAYFLEISYFKLQISDYKLKEENGFKIIVRADKNFHQEYFEVATL